MAFIELLPRNCKSGFRWIEPIPKFTRSPIPSADRTAFVGPAWFCGDGAGVSESNGKKFTLQGYCGAPGGIRCSCGAQKVGHDPGDEDPRSP